MTLRPYVGLTFSSSGISAASSGPAKTIGLTEAVVLELASKNSDVTAAYDDFIRLIDLTNSELEVPRFSRPAADPIRLLLAGDKSFGILPNQDALDAICHCSALSNADRRLRFTPRRLMHLWNDKHIRIVLSSNILNVANVVQQLSKIATIRTFGQMCQKQNIVELTALLQCTTLTRDLLEYTTGTRSEIRQLTFEQYVCTIESLATDGFMTTPINQIEWGSFARATPICPNYGYSRGTPIDRYYLGQFLESVSNEVVGDTLEIGGRSENAKAYGLARCTSYLALDMIPSSYVDLVGDVHDEQLFGAETFQSVLALNVLEHCQNPIAVVQNVRRWLKPGGRFFCLVPNAQRVHRDPADYWRILPDAMELLLKDFSVRRVFTFGNMMTAISSLSGVCAEEIPRTRLDFVNPQYPVVTCAVAQRE